MKLTNRIFAIGTVTAVLAMAACSKDFLEQDPLGSQTEALFPQTAEDAILATNGVYGTMRKWQFSYGGFPTVDIMSDDARKGSNPGDGGQMLLFDQFTFTPTSNTFYGFYAATYRSIRSANVVIERVSQIDMDQNLRNRYVAEAKFLRAFFYFRLTRAFGGVPLVTTVDTERQVGRTSVDEIYNNLIIPDLLEVINILPKQNDYAAEDKGRASQGAAQALLAKVYLYREDYANALEYAEDVIESNNYDLEPDFGDAFSLDGQFGIESVFELGAMPRNDGFENGGNQYANTQGVRGNPNKGWGFNRPSWDLIKSFEPGDSRLDATVIFLGEIFGTDTIFGDAATPDVTLAANGVDTLEVECYNQKTFIPGLMNDIWGWNVKYIRYADVLLWAAEAANELGDPVKALDYVNRVRQRPSVNLPLLTETNQIVLDDLIFRERRHELAMEQHRFYDLVRTDRAPAVLGPLGFIEGRHELWPIPQSEIDLSGGTLTQNNY